MRTLLFTAVAWLALAGSVGAQSLANGGFEAGLTGWRPLWTRTAGTGTLSLDPETVHAGRNAARLEHRGEQDWSLEPEQRITVNPGDVFAFEAWLKVESHGGSATLCVSTWDRAGHAVDWSFGARTLSGSSGWQRVRTRFVVPDNVAQIQPRLIGYGPATVWADDFAIAKTGNVNALRRPGLPGTLTVSN